ncbi:sigma factor-like helix-turn-helix DNA-binding protein [Nonomuraea sp. NPDC049504]|uniref:sigma factor-like helix-turn-helix DNA-binding protein n=1 Tax=Nonomuraea sp. NPDC049504 TaxID=3154729 RepID=UPI00344AD67D
MAVATSRRARYRMASSTRAGARRRSGARSGQRRRAARVGLWPCSCSWSVPGRAGRLLPREAFSYSHAEIAGMLGVSKSASQQHLHLALRRVTAARRRAPRRRSPPPPALCLAHPRTTSSSPLPSSPGVVAAEIYPILDRLLALPPSGQGQA